MTSEPVATGEVRVVRLGDRDCGTAQTPGMEREAAVAASTVGAERLWTGFVTMAPGFRSGAHHHGPSESSIYVITGHARFRYGDRLEFALEANAGDFVYVPPRLVHQEINVDESEPLEMIVSRDGQENVVVNVDIPEAEE